MCIFLTKMSSTESSTCSSLEPMDLSGCFSTPSPNTSSSSSSSSWGVRSLMKKWHASNYLMGTARAPVKSRTLEKSCSHSSALWPTAFTRTAEVTTATELCFTSKATSPGLILLNCLRKTVRWCGHLWWQISIVYKQNWAGRLWDNVNIPEAFGGAFFTHQHLSSQRGILWQVQGTWDWHDVDLWLGRSLSQGIHLPRNCSHMRSCRHSPKHSKSTCRMQDWQGTPTAKW